jgi:hypothetical protein
MKKIASVAFGLLSVFMMLRGAQAATTTYMPTAGAPFTGGASSFDWANWSYVDNVLTNHAAVARTWTLPLQPVVAFAAGATATVASMCGGTGNTTAQAVTNFESGSRFMVSARQVCFNPFGEVSMGLLTIPALGTAYVNFVVGTNGVISTTRMTQ